MPPTLSSSSLRSLSRCRCSATSIATRSFSSTSPVSAIGPENPKFIEVPIAPQPQAIPKRDIKGILPPPRDIFGRRGGLTRWLKECEDADVKVVAPESAETTDTITAIDEAVEDRRALKRLIQTLDTEPGKAVDYSAALEKSLEAIKKRMSEIAGRKDRAHELKTLQEHAKTLEEWPAYFKAVTPEPSTQGTPANDYVAWKQRMAATRRENLRAGLVELYYRKKGQEAKVAHWSRQNTRERNERLHAPQREDERLTNPTIRESVRKLQTGAAIPDPNRTARVQLKAARVKAKEIAREEQRRDALHTLYMHAREFIVTEKQLDDEIEAIFTDTPHGDNDMRTNIWEAIRAPITVQEMLSEVNRTEKEALNFHRNGAMKAGTRMKRIAEELTGGKMD